ncbi:hypothetical protein [Vibrio bathopelagicus]|uniref:hypothetical protein n=1 Tax=Vibrio bathopelagicus TaxID=2777577 RepID=UPI001864B076|nr:hypothetical protein [Vibrio bathopelagicus]
MNYKVIDKSKLPPSSLLKAVFIRNEDNRLSISRLKWFKLTALEILFGAELLENIINVSTVTSSRGDKCEYGKELKLNGFIPSGIFTNFFRVDLIEVLYFKYYKQYFLLKPAAAIEKQDFNRENKILDCSYIRFAAFKEVFYQVISLRRAYESCHFLANISVDITVFCYTNRIELALLSALVVESIRRLVKL